MIQIILTIISTLGVIGAAIVTGFFSVKISKISQKNNENQKLAAERSEQRKKESMLAMKLSSANTKLTVGVAMALKHGRANGEIEEGLKAVEEAQAEYDDFLKSVALQQIT